MTNDHQQVPGHDASPEPIKKPYQTPQLVVHGSVEEITQATEPGDSNDGFVGLCSG